MEVIIVLIIVAVVGYLIYQSLPNTKFQKAQNLFNSKDYVQAIDILNTIFDKHNDAPAKLAECKLNLGKRASTKSEKVKFFNEVTEIRKRISKSESIAKLDHIEANALFEIAKIQYEETNGDIDKLNQNIKFIDTANKKGFESEFSSLKEKHFYDLASSHFKKATDKEKSNKYPDAIQVYKKAIECSEKSSNNSVKHNSIARIEICNLKQMSLEYN
jgi:tetratricopeptide (TPR) repeat protein